ncbi:retrovirus-related Pol polyprotein from transposon 412 [Tautogolabrus adspersus]
MIRSDFTDSSDDEPYGTKERITTLRPGQFDGSGSWKDFLYQFESCAKANSWTEKTMAVQLRFSLTGTAGAIVHKNPKSARWSYQRIVEEIETAYGPCSEHAAAIGIELRQRVRRPGEALHTLRDDIYEKVSIVYADRSETDQDCISVEVFINALADAEVVQKLLEEHPRTLARAYDIAHSTHWTPTKPTQGAPKPNQQWQPNKSRYKKTGFGEVICHNCSGVGHIQRACPSPRRPPQPFANTNLNPCPDTSTVVISTKSQEEEMFVMIEIHGVKICALLDSGARRNVLPLHHFNSIPTDFKPPVQPSTTQVLQGIGPDGLAVLGEVILPVHVAGRLAQVNFIMADTAATTEVILGHPFLQQTQARLDYGRREKTLFSVKVPRYDPSHRDEANFVRVARTTVLEPGCEYVVPGASSLHGAAERDMMLSPIKSFIEKHHVLVAHAVVQPQGSTSIPIRVFNPGAAPVTLRGGAVAGVLQPAQVLEGVEPLSTSTSAVFEPVHPVSVSVPSHLRVLYDESCSCLSEEDCCKLAYLLQSYSDVLSTSPTDLGRTNIVQHDILTTPGPPVKQPRRMAREKQTAADHQVEQSLEAGFACPSNSSWAAPIVMVKKKDNTPRLCVDYRPLNERTIKDAYPLPRIQDTLDTLSNARYFSTLDLTSGYWQVELTPRARKAAAFCTRKGLFEWNVMPFGLCNAPATFQRLMDRVLVGLQWETCLVYLDDIVVLGRDSTQMLERLGQVFNRLRGANLKLKPSKCCLFREQVAYLGHIVSANGVTTDPKKIQQVQDWPTPRNVSEVRQFVGLASYYRRFVADFATIAKPLHELTKKYARFHWTEECQEAFTELKGRLTAAPILGYPLDKGELLFDTDASDCGIGAVLSQVQGDEERVLAYGSRRLSSTEQNYCTTRRELLAVVEFASHFRQYLLGRPFTVRTDHSSLRWLTRLKEPEGQLARWLEKLAEYDFRVIHRPGKNHQNADALSRKPCRETCPCTVTDPSLSNLQYQHKGVQCDFSDCLAETVAALIPAGQPPVVVVEPDSFEDSSLAEPESPIVGVVDSSVSSCTSAEAHPSIHRVCEAAHTLFSGWTLKQPHTAQKTDPDIAPVLGWMEKGSTRPPWAEIAACSPATKAYWAQWKRLYQRDGVLLRRFYCKEGNVQHSQILLPHTFRKPVMEQMHDGPVGGHFGAERTLTRLKTRYYWYNMRDDVTLWCRTCTSCAAKACPKKTPHAAMGTVRVGAPMERIAVDLMGPLNETDRHNLYILVVQDYFSKWVEAYPVPDMQASTVAEKIVSEWVCRYGAPHSLHSDQGTNFESAVFQGMCELLGIEKTRTTPFRPQSDGQVERFNATLQKTLATTAERCHWDWDIMIPYAVMAYRATKHSSTGLTPNMMLYGREITEPVDLVVGLPPEKESYNTPPEYVLQLRERLELSDQLAREALEKSVERAKRQYDKNICQVQYQVGASVWHLIKGTKRVKNKVRKFLPSYEGPYFVVGQLDDLIYRIKKSSKSKAKVVHHDKLKLYHSRTPLDNSWVFRDSDVSASVETPAAVADGAASDTDFGPLNLWGSSSDTEDPAAEEDGSISSPPSPSSSGSWLTGSPARPQLGETDSRHLTGGPACRPTGTFTPPRRPRRVCKAPDLFGDWVHD